MKKIILGISFVLIIGGAIFLYNQSKNNSDISMVTNETHMEGEQAILLYPISGVVTYKATPDAIFVDATGTSIEIPNQSIIHTGIGKATVLLPDNSTISLENNTEITVNYSKTKTSIYQSFGETYHRVEKLLSGSSYQVQTAGTLAAVRGTKFVVKYDQMSKKTKVAVTESKVEVSTVSTLGGTKPQAEENMMVEVGKMVIVGPRTESKQGHNAMTLMNSADDIEMSSFIEEQKKVDVQMVEMKKTHVDKEDFRNEMKRVLFDDVEGKTPRNDEDDKKDGKKTENTKLIENKETKVDGEAKETTTTDTSVTVSSKTSIVTKVIGEEEFFIGFEPLFIKYFYIDESDSTCSLNVSDTERVRIVTSFATKAGYPFTNPTLLSFATAINNYCLSRDKSVKIKLQDRFDDEYPF